MSVTCQEELASASDLQAKRELRPHQVRALDMLRESIAGGRKCPVLQAPTGAGKTRIGAEIARGARGKRKRVAFSVPALTLIDQTFDRFVSDGIDPGDMGIIQGDHPWYRPHAPIQICSAQTLARRPLPEVDIVVIDECHVRYSIYDRWMSDSGYGPTPTSSISRPPLFIGLTATPWAKGMGVWFDDLLKPTSISELIEAGYLSRFKVFAPSHPDLSGIKITAGDYNEGQLGKRMSGTKLVADVVSSWLAKGKGLPTLCFCVNCAHAQEVAAQFSQAGVRTAYIDADTPREEREIIGRRLAAGEVEVVVNIGTLTTGVDWDVRCLILARPTKSRSLFVQIVGRALRTAPGKEHALILDHSDTHLRLGMVTDIDRDELDDGKPKSKSSGSEDEDDGVRLPKECKACSGLVPAGMRECPCCGARVLVPSGVVTEHGELQELTAGGWGNRHVPRPPAEGVVAALKRMGECSILGQLEALREDRGRSNGWVLANFKDIFGKWPPRGMVPEPGEPSRLLRRHLQRKAVAYAKAMAAREQSQSDDGVIV